MPRLVIQIRVTAAERAAYRHAARVSGLSLSAWMRWWLREGVVALQKRRR